MAMDIKMDNRFSHCRSLKTFFNFSCDFWAKAGSGQVLLLFPHGPRETTGLAALVRGLSPP